MSDTWKELKDANFEINKLIRNKPSAKMAGAGLERYNQDALNASARYNDAIKSHREYSSEQEYKNKVRAKTKDYLNSKNRNDWHE